MGNSTIRIAVAAVLAIGVIVGVWLATRGGEDDPETQIARMLDRAVLAAEERKVGDLMEVISERFQGNDMNKSRLKGLIFFELNRHQWRRVFLVGTEIDVRSEDKARVRTAAVLAAGDDAKTVEEVLPKNASTYRFDLEVEKEEDGEWRIVTARYRQATGLQDLIE